MATRLAAGIAALAMAGVGACDLSGPVVEAPLSTAVAHRFLTAPVMRPFKGTCTVAVVPRVHDDEEGGGCGGEEHEDPGGGPPISRHFDIQGSCNLTHLGLTQVTGRLNLTGPFGSESHEDGHGALGARGRLAFVAANGDQLVGRYIPIQAVFTGQGGDGGLIVFTSTLQFNTSCSDPGGGGGHGGGGSGGGCSEGEEGCAEPVSTGRFTTAAGEATLLGSMRIFKSTGGGSGSIEVTAGGLSY